MTVYDYCHLGHGRVMVVFDMVYRWLRHSGYQVNYVRNITDIDDKIIQRARDNQESMATLTQRFITAMHEDARALNTLPPSFEPKATAHISNMVAMISLLLERGMAYVAENGDVCYSVQKFARYGRLSGKSLDDLRAGARVEVDTHKHNPLDFVLWKLTKAHEQSLNFPDWDSPWGKGRPGWHIECSAMSQHHLGESFDIHGGGQDLQFPHHENEIAQSEAAHGQDGHTHKMVNYWMHNGFVRVLSSENGQTEKMSKSLGNFFTIREVLRSYSAEVVRFFILRTHYRSPLNYTPAHLSDAQQGLNRLYTALRGFDEVGQPAADIPEHNAYVKRFKQAMDDDFNTPEALAVLFDLANSVNKSRAPQEARLLYQLGAVLGLLTQSAQTYLQASDANTEADDVQMIEQRIAQRQQAKQAKDFATADSIRYALLNIGVILEDTPQGTLWRRR